MTDRCFEWYLAGLGQAGVDIGNARLREYIRLAFDAGIGARWGDRVGYWTRLALADRDPHSPDVGAVDADWLQDRPAMARRFEGWAEQTKFVARCAERAARAADALGSTFSEPLPFASIATSVGAMRQAGHPATDAPADLPDSPDGPHPRPRGADIPFAGLS